MPAHLRIGLIGAGNNTLARHIPGLHAEADVEIVAVCNRRPASTEQAARELGIPRTFAAWEDLVRDPDIDAVVIGTWPYLHAPVTLAALESGKHVLTEARMARNLAEAELMLAEARLHPQLVAQIVPAPMSLPFDATVIDMIQAGALGVVREVFLTATTGGLADSSLPLSWRQDLMLSGKNTLYLGIYYEMILRWLGRGVSRLQRMAGRRARCRAHPGRPGPSR